LFVWVDTERLLAATLSSARVSFSAAIDAAATTASGRMDNVDGLFLVVTNGEGRNAIPALFLDGSQQISPRGKVSSLVAATLAAPKATSTRTIDRQQFGFRVEFFHFHFERVDGLTEHTAAATGIFQTVSKLLFALEELELCTSFATKNFLAPSSSSLLCGGITKNDRVCV